MASRKRGDLLCRGVGPRRRRSARAAGKAVTELRRSPHRLRAVVLGARSSVVADAAVGRRAGLATRDRDPRPAPGSRLGDGARIIATRRDWQRPLSASRSPRLAPRPSQRRRGARIAPGQSRRGSGVPFAPEATSSSCDRRGSPAAREHLVVELPRARYRRSPRAYSIGIRLAACSTAAGRFLLTRGHEKTSGGRWRERARP